jgi:hypothetical protein
LRYYNSDLRAIRRLDLHLLAREDAWGHSDLHLNGLRLRGQYRSWSGHCEHRILNGLRLVREW